MFWEIVQCNCIDCVFVFQVMFVFQELNLGVFVDGNINWLKSGQVLCIFIEQQMLECLLCEVLFQVQVQNQSWCGSCNLVVGSVGVRQLDVIQCNVVGLVLFKVDVMDNLCLVFGEGKVSKGVDKGGKGDSKVIVDILVVIKESFDSICCENEELQSCMQDLQSQLDKLQKLIQLKDVQLVKL